MDFYHATEHLVEVAKACKGWSAKQCKTWWRKQQRLLLKGNDFTRHWEHLGYDRLTRDKFPIGSGAIESAIRRVVNLRLKSAATFWKASTAEGVLLLRPWFKAGRWNTLENIALAPTPECVV